ncbi:hypothetical protein CR513_35322, partial [Mucuna pruriens]
MMSRVIVFLGRSRSMSTCFSGDLSEEEVGDGCLDDWEATLLQFWRPPRIRADFSRMEFKSEVPKSHFNRRACKSDDALRPHCLPNLSNWHNNRKTTSFLDRYFKMAVVPLWDKAFVVTVIKNDPYLVNMDAEGYD